MTVQEEALVSLARLLDAHGVEYIVVGGLANAVWGEPRATIDIDIIVWVADDALAPFLEMLGTSLSLVAQDALAFARETRVVPASSPDGVRVDVILGMLPFEREAIQRAVTVDVGKYAVRFASAEDLVLMKIISDRERDLADAEAMIRRRAGKLDLGYLEPRIAELARLLDRPEITRRWSQWRGSSA